MTGVTERTLKAAPFTSEAQFRRAIERQIPFSMVGESIAGAHEMIPSHKMSQKDARGEISGDIRLQFQI